MERDELREAWASFEAHLERTERLNDLLVTQSMARGAQTALAREQRALWFEIALNCGAVAALGSFAGDHAANTGALVCAAILGAALLSVNVVLLSIVTAIRRLDFEEPVLAIQSALERVKMRRAQLTAAILLAGPLLWTPLLIVGISLLGLDAVRVLGVPYVAANVALGVVVAIGGWLAARHFAPRLAASRWVARAADALSGSTYREASEFLDTIERFKSAA